MSAPEVAAVLAAGVAMGFINNLGGGGGLIGLAALELAVGLLPMEANVALRLSALNIGLLGMVGFRTRGMHIPRKAWGWGIATIPGALLGSWMALNLEEWIYQVAVLGVIGLVGWQQLRPRGPARPRSSAPWEALILFSLAGAHMGFLQVAVGLLTMAALTRVYSDDLVQVNAAKMAVLVVSGGASVLYFVIQGVMPWAPALVLAAGCGGGSFLASRWSVAKGHRAIRFAVLGICVFALLRTVWKLLASG